MERALLQGFIAEGLTVDGIASSAGVSVATVEKWLGRHNLETTRAAKQRAARAAVAEGDGVVVRECLHHGLTEFKQRGDTSAYRCLRCRAEAVARRRRKVKDILVAEAGGACAGCGYSRYVGALHFHHRDPAEKTFSLSHAGVTRSISAARAEAAKCVLLCANCHAEVEAGIASLP